jgi:hypothetical protein
MLQYCRDCISEQRTQRAALNAAVANLDTHRSQISRQAAAFQNHTTKQQERHLSLLTRFEPALAKLASIQLHPMLCHQGCATLQDCIPVDRERDWAMRCKQALGALTEKVAEMIEKESGLKAHVQKEIEDAALAELAPSLDKLEHAQANAEKKFLLQSERAKGIESNYDYVRQAVTSINERNKQGSQQLENLSTLLVNLEKMQGSQNEVMEAIMRTDKELREHVVDCSNLKNMLGEALFVRMRSVARLMTGMRPTKFMINALREASFQQAGNFGNLEHVHQLPTAYASAQLEVVRRRAYGRRLVADASSAEQRWRQMRHEELELRKRFLREHGQHLPTNLIPGLADAPPRCWVHSRRSLEEELPTIDKPDAFAEAAHGRVLKQRREVRS